MLKIFHLAKKTARLHRMHEMQAILTDVRGACLCVQCIPCARRVIRCSLCQITLTTRFVLHIVLLVSAGNLLLQPVRIHQLLLPCTDCLIAAAPQFRRGRDLQHALTAVINWHNVLYSSCGSFC